MGTTWSLAIAGALPDPRRVVQDILDKVITESSLWDPQSEISRFNQAPANSRFVCSAGLLQVVRAAIEIAQSSDGAFDPTIGALSDLWGFGPKGEQPIPNAAQIATARRHKWSDLAPQEDSLFQPGGVQLDLNAIAKGQAVDRVAEALMAAGERHFLIGIGGEYRGEGVRPDYQPWWVDIEQPPTVQLPPLRLALSGWSVATSGDYRRAFWHKGKQHSHSLDPHSGQSIEHQISSVAVVGRSCMRADAQATAITVMGPVKGLEWAKHHQLPVQILWYDGHRLCEELSPALQSMLE